MNASVAAGGLGGMRAQGFPFGLFPFFQAFFSFFSFFPWLELMRP